MTFLMRGARRSSKNRGWTRCPPLPVSRRFCASLNCLSRLRALRCSARTRQAVAVSSAHAGRLMFEACFCIVDSRAVTERRRRDQRLRVDGSRTFLEDNEPIDLDGLVLLDEPKGPADFNVDGLC